MNIKYFLNDSFKIMKMLYEHRETDFKGEVYAPLSQQKMSDIVGFSKPKVNELINELIKEGFIEAVGDKRAKYELTKEGLNVYTYLNKKS